MMNQREYKLFLTGRQKLQYGLPAIMFTVMPIIFYFTIRNIEEGPPDFFPYVFWLFAAAYWWELLTIPHTICVTPTDQIEFRSVLRRRPVAVGDIVSIGPGAFGLVTSVMGGYMLKHRGGKVGFINQFTGMHELLADIRRSNPMAEFLGC